MSINNENCLLTSIQDITLRKQMQDELLHAHRDLEKKVAERTLELAKINEKLTMEIMERMKSEAVIQESEEKYHSILENIDEMYFELDLKGNITFFNDSTCRISGYSPSEAMGMNFRQYTPPETAKQLKALFGKIYLTGETSGLSDFDMINKDKSIRCLELSAKLLKNPVGEAIGFRCIARDITSRKQAEKALRESEQKYRLLAENSVAAIWIVNLEGSFTYMSLAIEKLLGYTVDEVMEMQMPRLIVQEDYDDLMMILTAELAKPHEERLPFYKRQIRCNKKDGTLLDAEISVLWLKDDQGNIVGLQGSVSDITERKQAEAALLENEARYRLLSEHMTDTVWLMDMNLKVTYYSPSVGILRGFTAQEAMEMPTEQHITPESLKLAFAVLSEEIPKVEADPDYNPIRTLELEYYCKDGSILLTENKFSIIRDERGRPVSILGEARDIRERKRAEEALRKSEKYFKEITENSSDVIIITDKNGNIKYCSRSIERFTGYKPEELIGRSGFTFIHPDDVKRAVADYGKAILAIDSAISNAFRIVHKDGSERYFEGLGKNLLDNPDVTGFIMNINDITDRKRAEESLRESELFLRETQAIALMGGWKANPENDFLQWTEGVYHLVEAPLDYHPGLAEGMKYYTPETTRILRERILNTLATNEPFVEECEIITASGKKLWTEVSGLSHVMEGQTPCVMGTIRDITEHKQAQETKRILEERLKQADKMEAIGTLAGGIAHDFNNLLMGIQGYASLTLKNLNQDDPNYERLLRIEEQVQSGADLTKQLLGFARGGRYEIKTTDMNEIIKKTSSMFARTKKEISINRKSGKDLWSVEVDRGQMEQIFLNLYVNAWQAMPGGGDIYLETDNVILDDEQTRSSAIKPGKYVKISITDTGTGMDEKTKERIFEPFFTTKKMGRGTGLGLATVYGIIKGHCGMINVYSEPDRGTTFNIYLPASDKGVVQEQAATRKIVMGKETILLVDDENMVMDVNRQLLESLGYKVYVAGSGQEAIAVYMEKKNKFDLVILDMIMPGISGGETFDRLRAINPNVKVLLSSGYSLNGEAKTIMDRGCNGFLQKPFQLSQFSCKVREMID